MFTFKEGAKAEIGTEDPWYALTEGYLKPEDVLANRSEVKKVKDALEVIQTFLEECCEKEVIEEA